MLELELDQDQRQNNSTSCKSIWVRLPASWAKRKCSTVKFQINGI